MTSDRGRRVVITGVGLVTALGPDRPTTWAALCRGDSGARWLDPAIFGSEAAGFPIRGLAKSDDRLEPALGLLARASDEAMADAGHPADRPGFDPDRAFALIGLSKGGVRSLGRVHERVRSGWREPDDGVARDWLQGWPGSGAGFVADRFAFRGGAIGPVAACASGLVAVLQGADLIRRGICDLALVGAADASIEPLVMAAFRRMRVLADVGLEPTRAVRPWDSRRTGFLVGEGAAVLVLEPIEAAQSRGRAIYAEVAGGALGSDAFHETALDPDPAGLAGLIVRALRDSGVDPADVDAVHVHGTATPSNDPLECRAIRLALGSGADRVVCSASKAQVGHLLGASGAVELALAAIGVREGVAPPTLNLDDPDPACDLETPKRVARSITIRSALKLSLGFGGHLAVAVLRRVAGGI